MLVLDIVIIFLLLFVLFTLSSLITCYTSVEMRWEYSTTIKILGSVFVGLIMGAFFTVVISIVGLFIT